MLCTEDRGQTYRANKTPISAANAVVKAAFFFFGILLQRFLDKHLDIQCDPLAQQSSWYLSEES